MGIVVDYQYPAHLRGLARDIPLRRAGSLNCRAGEGAVQLVGLEELLVAALARELAGLEEEDPVGVEHGRQPVRDDERGPARASGSRGLAAPTPRSSCRGSRSPRRA